MQWYESNLIINKDQSDRVLHTYVWHMIVHLIEVAFGPYGHIKALHSFHTIYRTLLLCIRFIAAIGNESFSEGRYLDLRGIWVLEGRVYEVRVFGN